MKRTAATLIAALLLAGLFAPAIVVAQQDDMNRLIDVPIGHFRGHDYKWVPEHRTWHEAVAYCEEDGGHLVTISSAAENRFVWARRPGWSEQSWLGASDEAEEGVWRWVTGEPFTYTNWGPGEPNDADASEQGRGEDYMTFHGLGGYAPPLPGVWNDWQYGEDGSESVLPFTCEYE